MSAAAKPIYTVQVRELVAFVLRRGDLGGERDFVASDRALAGTRGHQKLQRARPPGYEKEVALTHDLETDEFILRIRGRIDGLLAKPDELVLEEIKTVQGVWNRVANPLHWAQAKCYGSMYLRDHPREQIVLQLTYLELQTGVVSELRERFSPDALAAFFQDTVAVYLEWIQDLHSWRRERDQSVRSLAFPFTAYRSGQRELAVAAYRTLAAGGRLFLEAPTGIGKTMSVIYPAIKALGEGKLERIFYLTARTIGRAVAEKAFADLRSGGLRARTVTLTAKEKVCVREGKPCDSTTCPLALGYYDRHKPAMRAALSRSEITRSVLESIGKAHQVCPFELALDVSSWVDAVICDYNYVFDPRVYLRRHFSEDGGDYGFLVDEAHNLVDRAREMFSADLDAREIDDVRRALKTAVPRCAKALARLSSVMRKLAGSADATAETAVARERSTELSLFPSPVKIADAPTPGFRLQTTTREQGTETRTSRQFPPELLPALGDALKEAEVWLAKNLPAPFRDDLLMCYFRLNSFARVAELFDERYATVVESAASVNVRLYCLDPSFLLARALERGKAAVFFSATLTPVDYFRALLGGMPEDPVLQLPSPFPTENLAVLVEDRLQTHFKARADSLAEVVESIAALVRQKRGNYLVYLPSYQYLKSTRERFQTHHPQYSVLAQQPGMTEAERDAFLAAFTVEHGEMLIGFAVLGGVFGEGIDLVGERLIGAVIVGVGLPQLCVERDLIRDYFQDHTSTGFDFAYTFPGMNRVLQAVGRVIRSETDRGAVLLIDARFGESRYRRLFPAWWQIGRVRSAGQIGAAAAGFWEL